MKKRRITMQEKRYLQWYHKIGYGSGDIAGNCVYALLTAFMMIYLTCSAHLKRENPSEMLNLHDKIILHLSLERRMPRKFSFIFCKNLFFCTMLPKTFFYFTYNRQQLTAVLFHISNTRQKHYHKISDLLHLGILHFL